MSNETGWYYCNSLLNLCPENKKKWLHFWSINCFFVNLFIKKPVMIKHGHHIGHKRYKLPRLCHKNKTLLQYQCHKNRLTIYMENFLIVSYTTKQLSTIATALLSAFIALYLLKAPVQILLCFLSILFVYDYCTPKDHYNKF